MKEKKIGLLTAYTLVIANMVGTGVFSSLGFQVGPVPSTLIILFLWLCGGIIALCGGLSYIELSKIHGGSGGEYHYILGVYPRAIAYFAGAVSVIAGFAAPVALAAITFGRYIDSFFPLINHKWLAFIIISLITFFHCFTLKLGSRFQLITTAAKMILLIVFILYGLQTSGLANPFRIAGNEQKLISGKGFIVSLVYVSFAYSGWNACVYIFGEIRNPARNISRSIIGGTLIVTSLYILLNFVFLKTVPIASLTGVVEVGLLSAKAIFGVTGGRWMAVLIAMLLISSMSAMVWVGPRVIAKMTEGANVRSDGQATPKIPHRAVGLQYLITVLLLLTDTFEGILMSAGILLSVCSCLSVAILFLPKNNIPASRLIAPGIFLSINIYTIFILLT